MIDRDQLHLVEIRDFAQFLRDTHFVLPVHRLQCLARNLHVFVVIHRKIAAIARGRAQRRHAEHVGDESEFGSIPREDHGARAGEALRFREFDGLVDGLLRLILDQPVGPT